MRKAPSSEVLGPVRHEGTLAEGQAIELARLGAGEYVLAVGPEGGPSVQRKRLDEAGVAAVALGTRVLRAETAVNAGLAVIQHRLGDLR